MQLDAVHVVLLACCSMMWYELQLLRDSLHAQPQLTPPPPPAPSCVPIYPVAPLQQIPQNWDDSGGSSSSSVGRSSRGALSSVSTANILFNSSRMEFAVVTDLDRESRDPQEFRWRAVFKRGTLINEAGAAGGFRIEWWADQVLETSSSRDNRSMELSELIKFRHFLLGVCDYTGLVFRIAYGDNRHRHNNLEATNNDPKVFQRWAIADGDGHKAKPFKMEWATTKDGLLYLGSSGLPWVLEDGTVAHEDPMWVKTIDAHGSVQNLDWRPVYRALRLACNISNEGYLWHEAVHWDVRTRRWYFLPRKAGQERYHPHADQFKGTNLLLVATENFSDIQVHRVGPLEPEYGFTSLKKVPGSRELFMALKVREVLEDPLTSVSTTHTKLCVFDVAGNFYLQPAPISKEEDDVEHEGVVVVGGGGGRRRRAGTADRVATEGGVGGAAEGFTHVSNLKFEGLEFL